LQKSHAPRYAVDHELLAAMSCAVLADAEVFRQQVEYMAACVALAIDQNLERVARSHFETVLAFSFPKECAARSRSRWDKA
jgi:hypothetical protein